MKTKEYIKFKNQLYIKHLEQHEVEFDKCGVCQKALLTFGVTKLAVKDKYIKKKQNGIGN